MRVLSLQAPPQSSSSAPGPGSGPGIRHPQRKREMRSGIVGIEKALEKRAQRTDKEISKAFQDLDRLMDMAKPMVSLAKNISTKIRV